MEIATMQLRSGKTIEVKKDTQMDISPFDACLIIKSKLNHYEEVHNKTPRSASHPLDFCQRIQAIVDVFNAATKYSDALFSSTKLCNVIVENAHRIKGEVNKYNNEFEHKFSNYPDEAAEKEVKEMVQKFNVAHTKIIEAFC